MVPSLERSNYFIVSIDFFECSWICMLGEDGRISVLSVLGVEATKSTTSLDGLVKKSSFPLEEKVFPYFPKHALFHLHKFRVN